MMKFEVIVILLMLIFIVACSTGNNTGEFEAANAVGNLMDEGRVRYDQTEDTYKITGAGHNIWDKQDAFYFVWKKSTGDLNLSTRIEWEGKGKNPHRKAGWMIRQSLDDDAPYVDVVIHGDSLLAMQYRKEKGGPTSEIQAPVKGPAKIYLEKTDHVYSMYIEQEEKIKIPVGSVLNIMPDTMFTGLVVCSHDSGVSETAKFYEVTHEEITDNQETGRVTESSLEILNIDTGVRFLVYKALQHFEAPNWSVDGQYLLFNGTGKLYTIPISGGTPRLLDSGFADNCNNDHGFSPDGSQLAISHSPENKSLIYTLPAAGGTPKLITPNGPSYWHGWSPDGKHLVYCAQRNGDYDVYRISSSGGREVQLTSAPGLDDGPDYSPDGRYIYFNSIRTGLMKIWRMKHDGSNQEQITLDTEFGDWFPHPSPDGKWIVFLSYDNEVVGHPPNKDVSLRLMNLATQNVKTVARLFGGQGTINVPSWSPDSRSFAFVSYRQVLSK